MLPQEGCSSEESGSAVAVAGAALWRAAGAGEWGPLEFYLLSPALVTQLAEGCLIQRPAFLPSNPYAL